MLFVKLKRNQKTQIGKEKGEVNMEISLTKISVELLDALKKQMINDFQRFKRKDLVSIIQSFDYNDIVLMLNYGFSEKAFFETVRGEITPTPFYLSKLQLDQIALGLHKMKGGT
jgi:hypothetical protein